jgi:hypothetical protein
MSIIQMKKNKRKSGANLLPFMQTNDFLHQQAPSTDDEGSGTSANTN